MIKYMSVMKQGSSSDITSTAPNMFCCVLLLSRCISLQAELEDATRNKSYARNCQVEHQPWPHPYVFGYNASEHGGICLLLLSTEQGAPPTWDVEDVSRKLHCC
jgi:hypothetical protein